MPGVIVIIGAALLGGCQFVQDHTPKIGITPDLGINRLMALPKPFESRDKSSPLLQTAFGANDVALAPIKGMSDDDAVAFGEALTKAADGYDILVLTSLPERPTYTLDGVATKLAGQLHINWELRNPNSELVRQFEVTSQVGPQTNAASGLPDMPDLASQTAVALSIAMTGTGGAAPAIKGTGAQATAPVEPPKIRIGAVTGAPGNGNRALPAVLRVTLDQDGLVLTEDPAAADYTITADVKDEPLKNGAETISIAWRVLDRGGAIAGEIKQTNQVPAGSLDKDWGPTAYDVAAGVENGLIQLLTQVETRRRATADQAAQNPAAPKPAVGVPTDTPKTR